jgi:hypothetical protein
MFLNLRQELKSEQVARDLRSRLDDANWRVEIEEGEWVEIGRTETFEIVARSCHAYEYEMNFGDHYHVLVAVGGVREVNHGVPRPRVSFVSMIYSPKLELITLDFSRELP